MFLTPDICLLILFSLLLWQLLSKATKELWTAIDNYLIFFDSLEYLAFLITQFFLAICQSWHENYLDFLLSFQEASALLSVSLIPPLCPRKVVSTPTGQSAGF